MKAPISLSILKWAAVALSFIGTDIEKVNRILEKGQIPIISMSLSCDSPEEHQVEVVPATESTPYFAISHV